MIRGRESNIVDYKDIVVAGLPPGARRAQAGMINAYNKLINLTQ
jgi:hypothetical protein